MNCDATMVACDPVFQQVLLQVRIHADAKATDVLQVMFLRDIRVYICIMHIKLVLNVNATEQARYQLCYPAIIT